MDSLLRRSHILVIFAVAFFALGAVYDESVSIIGNLYVQNAKPYGHPGTPLSVIRINQENALSSVARFSTRPEHGVPQPGLGECLTFQMPVEPGGRDKDLAHFCVSIGNDFGARVDLWVRNAQGRYRIAQTWR